MGRDNHLSDPGGAGRTADDLIAAALRQARPTTTAGSREPPLPDCIGAYRIRRVLGAGGMGVVYEAEQEHPIRRRVALKVIQAGLNSRDVVARFEAERQALALMDHPNIARVFEAGATGEGWPYFVMEYVPGVRITEHCDQFSLGIPERLGLFAQVCQAVQHAHQRGIIHRDLKPSNVLVMLQDDRPVPKIIDFGVAKALRQRLTEHTLVTQTGRLIGTLQYMSPEQLELGELEINTLMDIYSLGVLLYELLVGTWPYRLTSPAVRNSYEIQRAICEQEPIRPSFRLGGLGGEAANVAEDRGTTPAGLRRQLRGDLDWITMKALEKDRSRRYGSASDLAADVQRHLQHEPVTAGPPSTVYRVGKFVRRNRWLVAGSALILLVLLAGIVVSTTFAIGQARARRETQRTLYLANISAAQFALLQHNVAAVRQNLNDAPREWRNWEWRYLNAAADQSVATFVGHTKPVWAVAVDKAGARIATGSEDKTVRIWDIATGTTPKTLKGHTNIVYSVAFSPDGDMLASGSKDGTVCLWDAVTGEQKHILKGDEGGVLSVVFRPDGKQMAFGGGNVRIWDVATGQELRVLSDSGNAYSLAYRPDGTHLAVAMNNQLVNVWNAETGEKLHILTGHEGIVRSVAYSPDGGHLAFSSEQGTIRLWNTDKGQYEIIPELNGMVQVVAFSPDGRRLVTGADDQTVRIWDIDTGDELAVLHGHAGYVQSAVFLPDGNHVVSVSRESEGNVRLWNIADTEQFVVPVRNMPVSPIVFSPDSTQLASRSKDGVWIWNLVTGQKPLVNHIKATHYSDLSFSADGTYVAAGTDDGQVQILDASNGELLRGFKTDSDGLARLALDPTLGKPELLITASQKGTLGIWDAANGRKLDDLEQAAVNPAISSFSRDGLWIAFALPDDSVAIWDVAARARSAVLPGLGDPVHGLALNADGSCVASGTDSGTIHVREIRPEAKTRQMRTPGETGSSLAFSRDGTRLASGTRPDPSVRIWEVATARELAVLKGHRREILSVAFSPDDTRLASGSRDGTIRIWDTVPVGARMLEREATLAAGRNEHREAETLFREVLERFRSALGDEHPGTFGPQRGLVGSLIAQEMFALAEPIAIECYKRHRKAYGPDNLNTALASQLLIDLYTSWGKADQAAKWRTTAKNDVSATEREP